MSSSVSASPDFKAVLTALLISAAPSALSKFMSEVTFATVIRTWTLLELSLFFVLIVANTTD
jgi:hypothetical protein